MAEIALPRQQVTQAAQPAGIGSPLYQRRRISNSGPIELLPNPNFTFPQRAPEMLSVEPTWTPNTRPMSLQAYPTGRRGSTPGARQKSVSALPDFSFNPSGATTDSSSATSTPPISPMAEAATPSRPIGHRRGGSEFIGGDAKSGGASLLSTSPAKGDGFLPPPSTAGLRPGPPGGRRGHAHRRSGAISSHDLSSIMRPAEPTAAFRTGSAPVTPLDKEMPPFGHTVNKSVSQPSLRTDEPANQGSNSPQRPPSRARVGFSDKVEYIRPLSTISSETETSLSTFRGHSATGSLSSVISIGAPSPPTVRPGRTSLSVTPENEGRPRTAGAVLDKQKQVAFGGDLFTRKRPMSAVPQSPSSVSSSSPRLPPKRFSFWLEKRHSDSAVPTLHGSASDPSLAVPTPESPLPSPKAIDTDEDEDVAPTNKSKSRKSHLKPQKVKSWANSLISRKGKQGQKGKGRPPTPPPQDSVSADEDEEVELDFEANFDIEDTVTIVSPMGDTIPPRKVETDIASWKPRELCRVDSDTMSPVIDLDAALGPFNTPQGPSPRVQQRGFAAHRRAMHSAGGVLQHHRRTESAPELVPFEHRPVALGSASTMADVFEEDEPEEESEDVTKPGSPRSIPEDQVEEPKIQVVEADHANTGSTIQWNFNDGLRIRGNEDSRKEEADRSIIVTPAPASEASKASGPKRTLAVTPVEVVEDHEEPRASSLTRASERTFTPSLPIQETKAPPPPMSLSLPLRPTTVMTPDTVTSSFSDFRSSQTSFDTPRLNTASSSVTDYYHALPSPHFGEPGPEVRKSDDIPSLTSSRSTMTVHHPFGLMSPRQPGDRSASLCSIHSDLEQRRRKRSSIASLSRLINGSASFERSKLSNELRPKSECLEPPKDSKKKHKRLSKLMNFWKPKDASSA